MTSAGDRWTVSEPEFQADAVVPLNPVYPWAGHRNFAYDLVRWMRPGRIAELGVHWGTSFFAFAQAIKDGRFPCELVGVDTFKGEEHSGEYGEEVFTAVGTVVDRFFRNQTIVLHRMFFSEALERVADGSVDLLHIDGLHTHEAARFDFLSWLPKLAPEGIVLFHDTAPSTGYGSANFWKEVSAEFPSFAFHHSWGLGVLFPKGEARLRVLRDMGLEDKVGLYTYKAEFRLAEIRIRDLTKMADQRHANLQDQARLIEQKDARLGALAREIELLKQLVADREAWLADLRGGFGDAETLRGKLRAAEIMCTERYEIIQKMGAELHQAKQRLGALDHNLTRAHAALHRRVAEADALERGIKEHQAVNEQLKARLDRLQTDVELLMVRAEHVEDVVAHERTRVDALMRTRAGRKAAPLIPPAPVVIETRGTNGAAR